MSKFLELKQMGKITVQVDGEELHIFRKQFDPDTGEELLPKEETYAKRTLEENKVVRQQQVIEYIDMLSEFEQN